MIINDTSITPITSGDEVIASVANVPHDELQAHVETLNTALSAEHDDSGLHSLATSASDGFMSLEDFIKLDLEHEDGGTHTFNYLRKNCIINGDYDIWQRGVSQTSDDYGSDDRWINSHAGSTKVHTRQSFTLGQTDVPNNPKYYSRTVVTSVADPANFIEKLHKIEDVTKYAGKTITLSFYAKADASKNIATDFYQFFGTGGSPSAIVGELGVTTHNLTTSWQKLTMTVTLPSVSGKTLGDDGNDYLNLSFWFEAGSDFDARTNSLGQQSGTFEIAQVQIEEGSNATDFEMRTIGEELALCQRYYEKSYDIDIDPGTSTSTGQISEYPTRNTADKTIGDSFKVTKRSIPTITLYAEATGNSGKITNNGDKTATAVSVGENGISHLSITSGDAANSATYHYTADAEL